MQKPKPYISIVVPALNEEQYLDRSLSGFMHQSSKDFEIIVVVDARSTDRTAAIARRYGTVVLEKRRGVSIARNTGAKAAKGKVVVFTDADTRPSRRFVAAYAKAFSTGGIVAATGPLVPLERSGALMQAGFMVVSVAMVKASIMLGRASMIGSNFAVRRDVFKRVGGFREDLKTYEDWELSERLRKAGRVAYVDQAVAYTSTRRVHSWGVLRYSMYHAGNVLRYLFTRRPKTDYKPVR
jgi:glycosyltransferase involved in cell wall biosynthesis